MCGCMLMHAAMDHQGHQHGATEHEGHQHWSPQQSAAAVTGSGRKCAHCSFPLEEGFAYCPNCGMSAKSATCAACGRKVEATWSACAYCGHPIGEAQPA